MKNQNAIKASLQILSLEDSERDFEIIRELLIDEGYDLKMDRVEKEQEFVSALRKGKYDIILADFNLPDYDAFAALKKSIEICPDVPFIIVSGIIGEESAIKLIKKGATDYVLKYKLERLTVIIQRTLEEVKKKEKANVKLELSDERYRLICDNTPDALFISDLKGITIEGNLAMEKLLGLSKKEIIGENFLKLGIVQKNQIPKALKLMTEGIFSKSQKAEEFTFHPKDGTEIFVELNVHLINFLGEKHILGICRDITARKLAADKLKQTNARHAAMIENIGDVIAILGDDGKITYQSPNIEKYFGWKPEDIIGTISFEKVHPEDSERIQKEFSKILGKETASIVEFRFKCKDGTYKWIELTAINRINEPAINGVLLNYHDISKRKQAEQLIRQKNEFLKLILDSLAHPFYVINASDYTIDIANSTAFNGQLSTCLTCYELTHKRGKPCNSLEHPCPVEIVKKTKKAVTLEHIHYDKNGSSKNVEVHAHPIFDNKGNVFQVIEYSIDITDRKKAEKELIESEEKYRTQQEFLGLLINTIPNPVFYKDSQGNYMGVNTAFENFIGISAKNLIGKSVFEIGPKNIAEEYWEKDMELLKNPGIQHYEWEVQKKDGKIYNVIFDKASFTDNVGAVQGLIGIITDITERKQAEIALAESEAQLRELNATKDKFFRIIAHDLKSPFQSIMGFSNILLEKIQETDYQGIEKYAGIIENSSQRAINLLTNLMEWSQLQTGRMVFNPVTVEVSELINEITKLLNDAAQLKAITISTELPGNVRVLADKAMTSTILRNLVSNAIKFTHTGGTIIISAEQKQNEWMIRVSDSGIGIKKENINKLFRIEHSNSTKGTQQETGTGLGLILCKEFVEKQGGKIGIESQPGKGSQFYFTLPKINRSSEKIGD